jgi:hypothetical protein
MKVIIPLAGKGTRLRPHTHVTPKPMLRIAGKPVMDYVMDDVRALGGVEQVVYITGHLKEKVEAHARDDIGLPAVFVEQRVQDGTAGAVGLARPYVDRPVLIVFVDTIFDADLSVISTPTPTASSGRRRSRTTSASAWSSPTPTAHDAHRREAVDADQQARQHRPVLHPQLAAALRGHRARAHAAPRTRASTTSPTRSST